MEKQEHKLTKILYRMNRAEETSDDIFYILKLINILDLSDNFKKILIGMVRRNLGYVSNSKVSREKEIKIFKAMNILSSNDISIRTRHIKALEVLDMTVKLSKKRKKENILSLYNYLIKITDQLEEKGIKFLNYERPGQKRKEEEKNDFEFLIKWKNKTEQSKQIIKLIHKRYKTQSYKGTRMMLQRMKAKRIPCDDD